MTTDLITKAQAGNEDAFRELTEPHRRELQVHCYRMLGSMQDAEDAVQETLLAAWLGLRGFEGHASLRTWLYRIATNRCLNVLRAASRRPVKEWDIPGIEPPAPSRLGEISWLDPIPDTYFDGMALAGPEARYEAAESISLAFVTALQALPPRQIAVLVLRDVLGFPAAEVADMMDSTVESVNSALKRARAGLQHRWSSAGSAPSAPGAQASGARAPGAQAEAALAAKFARAYEAADVDTLVALLTDDAFISMPPMPLEYIGRDAARQFYLAIFGPGRKFHMIPTRANGQPAFGAYVQAPDGTKRGAGLFVLTIAGDRVCAAARFEPDVFRWFGLPDSLPA